MHLTSEQIAIIKSQGNIRINAVAGSGKTTTVVEYARTKPQDSKILYLAFNRSVRLEAAKKFAEKGLHNVQVETAHSLAYRYIVPQGGYKIRPQGYKTNEVVDALGLRTTGERHSEYIIANHISRFVAYFCNSKCLKVNELNYLDTITDAKAKVFVKNHYRYILAQTRLFLSKMENRELEITHDFYLKKFQIMCPELGYDYILFDEGQDASAAMLDVFLRQKATKVIVGDTHQQIYGWRFAVNSLQKADFKTFQLSMSFRFPKEIATLATQILSLKEHLGDGNLVKISGVGKPSDIHSKAIIARTNLGLLLKAIEYVTEKKKAEKIYFEGNINSYTYADDGASLYDVLNLKNKNRKRIRDPLIRQMEDLAELEDYVKKTEDMQLGMMIDIVKEYGNKIPGIIKEIKEKHIQNNNKSEAEMVFSTVHRCKGMEYDAVQLVNDFITPEKIEEAGKNADFLRLNEEINLLYVAATRAKTKLYIPETLVPRGVPLSDSIKILKVLKKEEASLEKPDREKAYTVSDVRENYRGAYQPWTTELDSELRAMFEADISVKDIALHFGRTRGAISSRLKKLEASQ